MDLDIKVSSFELVEGATYDVASVRIKVVDQNGNVLPHYNRSLIAKTEGPIEIVGPELIDINGGMGGIYVKSTGKTGKASLKVYFNDVFVDKGSDIIKLIDFDVCGGELV